MNKKRILVVDDDPAIVKALEQNLKLRGYDTLTASNGTDGLKTARAERPDLIILDIMMSGKDGGEVSADLSEDPETERIPIFFLTGLKSHNDPEESNASEHPVFAKPILFRELVAEIENRIGK